MTQNRQSGYGTGNAKIDLAPVPFGTMKTLGSGDYTYNLGQLAYEITLSQWVIYSGDGIWTPFTGTSAGIVSFTVPFGTSPVVPNGSGTIDWPAGNGFSITGGTNSMTGNMVSPFTGSFGFTSATSGATESVVISHSSNTANSNAVIAVGVAGTSSGDPFAQFSVGATRAYAFGIDTIDSQTLKITTAIAANVTPSTGSTLMQVTSTGIVKIPVRLDLGNATNPSPEELNIFYNNPGSKTYVVLGNIGTGAGSDSQFGATVDDATSDCIYGTNNVGAVVSWTWGQKGSDSQAFAISASNALGTNNIFRSDISGNITLGLNASSIIGFNNSTLTTVGAAGGADPLPLTPSGYLPINVNGSPFQIPYYPRS